MNISEVSAILRQAGVVGAGGAGFPTYAKLDRRAETIILNCAECEPLLKLHRQLLEVHAHEIVEAFHLIAKCVGAKEAVIGIKKGYQKALAALREPLAAHPEIRLGLLDGVYPAGDEVVLIYEVTGTVVPPGGLPIQSGVAVFNVETIYNAYHALTGGRPVTDKLLTVTGAVKSPATMRVPLGGTVEEAVRAAGGAVIDEPVYWVGGPMMGTIGSGLHPITKTTNAILVLPEDHLLVRRKKSKAAIELKRAAAACCQCTMCTDLCPRHLLGHPIEPHKFMRAATCKDMQAPDIFLNTLFCSSCGLCENYSCVQGLAPRSLMAEYKEGLKARGVGANELTARWLKTHEAGATAGMAVSSPEPAGSPAVRNLRKVPMERLMARLDLSRYDHPAPLKEEIIPVHRVKIPYSQHIGTPAIPAVTVGQAVTKGQVVAEAAEGLSVPIHASIDGKITEMNEKYVIIENQEQR